MSTVAIIGLGYVGLPLAVEFGKKYETIGYDLSQTKVESYRRLIDPTGEVSSCCTSARAPGTSAVSAACHRWTR